MTICIPRGGRDASPHLLVDNDDLVRAFAKVCVGGRRMTERRFVELVGQGACEKMKFGFAFVHCAKK